MPKTKTEKLSRSAYYRENRRERNGRFRASPLCDGCNKPVGTNYFTDEEVCSSTDGPGFLLCERKRCMARRGKMSVEERRAIYEANRNARGDE